MAGASDWWPCELKILEANYERCKLKVRQDSLYCKLFILEYQNRLEEERRITLKYEKKAICQRLQQAEVSSILLFTIFNIIRGAGSNLGQGGRAASRKRANKQKCLTLNNSLPLSNLYD